MLSHANIWLAIDRLARHHGLTPSGLARRAGLDPTTFNPSKRTSADDRPRWPSMESIAKILDATHSDLADFVALIEQHSVTCPPVIADATADWEPDRSSYQAPGVPVFVMPEPSEPLFLYDDGAPTDLDWPMPPSPDGSKSSHGDIAIRVSGDALLPLYRTGDVIVVSPDRALHAGDRVLVRLATGHLRAHVFERDATSHYNLGPVLPGERSLTVPKVEIDWVRRIVWASQ